MAAVLNIVCTPIGNLGDMTPRAVEAISRSALILAEDTRHTRKLLSALAIDLHDKKLVSCGQQDELRRLDVVLERLADGDEISFVSDAGAPGVSDPGGRLVEGVANAGFRVEVFPGVSAVTAAILGAGLDTSRYAFLGFLPKKGRERERLVKDAMAASLALVIFEAPQRVKDTLGDLHLWCGPQRVVVARELTKQYETFHRGTLGSPLTPEYVERGEAVIIVERSTAKSEKPESKSLEERLQELIAIGTTRPKDAAKILAKEYDLKSSDAYQLILNATKGF